MRCFLSVGSPPFFISLTHGHMYVHSGKHTETRHTANRTQEHIQSTSQYGGTGGNLLAIYLFFFVLDGQQQTCHPSIQSAHTHTNTQTLACMHANKHAINLHVSKSSKRHFSRCSIAREQLREQRAIQSREKEDDTHMFIQRNTERLHCSYTGLCSSSTRPSSHTCITHTHTQACWITNICLQACFVTSVSLSNRSCPAIHDVHMHASLPLPLHLLPPGNWRKRGEKRGRKQRVGGV